MDFLSETETSALDPLAFYKFYIDKTQALFLKSVPNNIFILRLFLLIMPLLDFILGLFNSLGKDYISLTS